jgi:hypothetical protein
LVERLIRNQQVAGSIPAGGSSPKIGSAPLIFDGSWVFPEELAEGASSPIGSLLNEVGIPGLWNELFPWLIAARLL